MSNEMIVSFVPSGGTMANAQAPYDATTYMPSCLNTGAGTITAFEYQIVAGGTYYFSDGLYVEQNNSSNIAGLTVTVTEPRTDEFWLTGFCEASSSAGPYTDGYTSGIWVAATSPTVSLSCNTLSADEPFTASFVAIPTAGTWAIDESATDWDFGDGTTSADAGLSVDHSYTPDTSADSWVISVSAYDIYSNLSNIATWHIGDTWSEADREAEGIRKWLLGYGKGTLGVPLAEL